VIAYFVDHNVMGPDYIQFASNNASLLEIETIAILSQSSTKYTLVEFTVQQTRQYNF